MKHAPLGGRYLHESAWGRPGGGCDSSHPRAGGARASQVRGAGALSNRRSAFVTQSIQREKSETRVPVQYRCRRARADQAHWRRVETHDRTLSRMWLFACRAASRASVPGMWSFTDFSRIPRSLPFCSTPTYCCFPHRGTIRARAGQARSSSPSTSRRARPSWPPTSQRYAIGSRTTSSPS